MNYEMGDLLIGKSKRSILNYTVKTRAAALCAAAL